MCMERQIDINSIDQRALQLIKELSNKLELFNWIRELSNLIREHFNWKREICNVSYPFGKLSN